jgi:uroporphyrinogen-III decarboxylase
MGIGPVDWPAEAARIGRLNRENKMSAGGLRHGHTFLQLSDIRGYMNLMYDMADADARLDRLIELVEGFNQAIVERYLAMNVDMMSFAEDLGMQKGPMISPEHFRKYIKPSYKKLMRAARKKDIVVHLHSDGDIRELIDDLADESVQIINVQDLVNGVDWIAKRLKGKICVELDLDRQHVTVAGTPRDIDGLIRSEVKALSAPEGGFAMIYGLYPGTPIENVKAIMDAMEKYAFFHG